MLKHKKRIIMTLGVFLGIITHSSSQNNKGYAAEFTIPSGITVNLNAATLNMPGTITVASSGTMQQSTGTITVSNNGNWSNSGTFTPGSGVVKFTGTSHTINGDSTFYNLDCQITAGTVIFEATKTQTISNSLTLKGASGSYLSLRSSSSGTQWKIYPPSTRDIDYVDLKDCNNTTNSYINISNWTNSGNNSYWGTAPSSDGGGGGGGGGGVTLSVSSVSPSSGATNVAVNTTISATFSLIMNGSSLNTGTFQISGGGSQVSGTVATNGANATFTPSSNLANNTTYTVTITTGAKAANAASTSLSSNYSWSFTTISGGASTPTPTTTPTATPSSMPTPEPSIAPSPSATITPSLTPTPTPVEGLHLSKYIAYLSGDTIVATVIDSDRNTSTTLADLLTTAIKITGSNYSLDTDLFLDLVEDDVNSGTFLATIKTGTVTTGGATSSERSNSCIIKAVQGGEVLVMYSDTTPSASTQTKTLALSSFDAVLAFSAGEYLLDSYAEIMLADAERNTDHTESESLTNDVFIETSPFNVTKVRVVETGKDTGTFIGSILVVNSGGTLEFDRIQAGVGDTLTVSYIDEINTTGFPRLVTGTASVVVDVTPIPISSPSPTPVVTPSITPTPVICVAGKMALSPNKLTLKKNKQGTIVVKVTGKDGCPVEGELVSAKINKSGQKRIKISSEEEVTDSQGEAIFTIRALKKTGLALIKFKAGNLKKNLKVKVKK